MLRKVKRTVFSRWFLVMAVTFGVFGAFTNGCIFEHGGGWHRHDHW